MNAPTKYIIGNVVASVCVYFIKLCKKKYKKHPKTAQSYCKSVNTRRLGEDSCMYMYL